MKLSRHQLMLLVDDDYRENQLKNVAGLEAAGDIVDNSAKYLVEVCNG